MQTQDPSVHFGLQLRRSYEQLGAVLGTAILIAIVGEPQTLADASAAADDACLFGILATLLAGVAGLRLAPDRARGIASVSEPLAATGETATR